MKYFVILLILVGLVGSAFSFDEDEGYGEEILILLEDKVRKVYYTGENIVSLTADPKTASVIFEAGKNATLDVKAPKVYKVGPDLFVLRNGEEVDAVQHSDECFFYATIETQQPETIEVIFAAWPEYMETVEDCETFTVAPLKQVKLGIDASDIVCKENLEIATKYDSSPVCVKPTTKQKLIERGWTSSDLDDIEKILDGNDCVEFGRWLDKHADGNYNQNLLIFDLPVPYDLSQRIYESIPDCIGDQSGFFDLNTKHIIDFDALHVPLKPEPNDKILQHFKDESVVKAFYAKYPDTQTEVRNDHVSYVTGSDDGAKIRMNLFFDENYEINYITLRCYVDRELQDDVAETFIERYLLDFECEKKQVPLTFDYEIKTEDVSYGSQYQITGGTVDDITYDANSASLIISLNESEKGNIEIMLPSGLLAPVNEEPFVSYFITQDGKEVPFEQLSPIILKIPFEKDTKKIEIIRKVWPKLFGESG